jgi:peptidoglycan hydrolase-like protein with peptidoglycan-binding domain
MVNNDDDDRERAEKIESGLAFAIPKARIDFYFATVRFRRDGHRSYFGNWAKNLSVICASDEKALMDIGGDHTRLAFWFRRPAETGSQKPAISTARSSSGKSARGSAFDNIYVTMRSVFLVGAIAFVVAGSVAAKENVGASGAEENVRAVQSKLADEGCYFGEIDGAYSSDFSTALSRYQIRNGLPITGQLDAETSKALNAKPAVGPSTATTEQSSDTWRQLRKRERRKSTKARQSEPAPTETSSPADNETPPTGTDTPIQTTPVEARTSAENTQPAPAPPAAASAGEFSADRLRDYVAAFVLAGLDKSVGAEAEFFADRVEYYDQGVMDREKIQQDLKRYDERWPERHFWVAGKINVEPQSENRVRVTFPLGFKLRNGNKQSSGKVDKTLVLEPAGEDLQIVAVNERKAG